MLSVDGPEHLTNWFAQTLMMSQSAGLKYGKKLRRGVTRYCNMTNGGPVFVDVKDGKILRMTPIDLTDDDGASWTIEAKGQKLTPPRKTTLAPHGQNAKSIVYSPDRLLYPMKRVDFDPNGERNPQNRGKSGYVRISWDEAIKIVTDEIKRQKREYGPGAITFSHGSHHTWGNIGYYLSALFRFANAVGMTRIHHNPEFVGRLVLGRGASLGPHAARRPVGNLRHGRGLPAELRHDRVVGGRSGIDVRLLRRAGRHDAAAMAERSEARHQGRPRRSLLQRHGAIPARQMVRAEADHLGRDGDGDRLCLDQGRPLRQILCRDAHRRLRQVEGLSARRRGRHCENAGMAGEGNRRSGQGRARAGARMGQEARLSRARRLGQRPRRRLPQPDRHSLGARDGVPRRHAGPRQARHQYGQSAMGHADRLQFLFPRLCRRRHVGRSRKHLDAGRALSAHAATADHEFERPAHPAHLRAGGDPRRQGRGLSVGRQVDRAPVPEIHLSGGRPFAGAHALQIRRLDPLDHEQHQSLGADVSVAEPRIRRQSVDLVRGRSEIRRRHPAGLHQFRAHRHQRMGRPRRLRPSRPAAAQSPRHRVPGAGDQAAGRIEIRLLDLQRTVQAARPRQLFLRRLQRDRLGQARLSRLRPAASTFRGRNS